VVLGALRERGSGGSGARPTGAGAWGEADRERAGAGSFGLGQGACNEGRERGSGGPERGRERGSGTLPLGARIGGPDRGGGRFGIPEQQENIKLYPKLDCILKHKMLK
jgi:hypothetical protein